VCSQARRAIISWAASKAAWLAGRGRGFCPSAPTPPGVLHPALEHSEQEGHGPVGPGPEEGHKNNQRATPPVRKG